MKFTNLLAHSKNHTAITIGLLVLLVSLSFFAGYIANHLIHQGAMEFSLLKEAYSLLIEHAYAPLPNSIKLEHGMIRGMLQVIGDPFTTFVEPPQHELQTNQLEGSFGGIGVRLEPDPENQILLFPLPDSPALLAGLEPADLLLSIDEMPVSGYANIDEIQAAIRGPVGTKGILGVQRDGFETPIKIAIQRAQYQSPSVTSHISPLNEKIGVITISIVSATTPQELTSAIQDLVTRGANSFILDLRNNGGGLIEAGVEVTRLFLPEGILFQEQIKGQSIRTYSSDSPGRFTDYPLVVVVNGNTASAAEMIALALQTRQRAPVIGSQTMGKDSIQFPFLLSDGSSVHITAGKWWVAGSSPTENWKGVTPDILLTGEETNNSTAIEKAIEAINP